MPATACPDPPRLALLGLLILAAAPLRAEDSSLTGAEALAWGRTASRAVVWLERAEDHPATVIFENRLTIGNPDEMDFTLTIDGMSVIVAVTMGAGDEPDVMSVSPPPGFEADPATIEVGEGSSGRIEIRYLPMS